MDVTSEIAKVKELLDKSHDVLIVTHEHPTFDSIGASLALYLGLTSLGKKVTIACPDPVTVSLSNFIKVNKVTTELGKRNFIISLDYVDGSIEKVSYNIEGDKFNLVIEPRPGFEPFSSDKVHYTYSGTAADMIFAVDTIHLGGLKKLYESEKELYATKPLINIDRHPNNSRYGQVNLIDAQASSTTELVAQLLAGIGARLTEDIATNILNGLFGATNNFQNQNVTPNAFELAAACLKAGGKRFSVATVSEEAPMKAESVAPQVTGAAPKAVEVQAKPVKPQEAQSPSSTQAPADWLKPKIFKSSNLS